MNWSINENAIPTLAVGFTRGMDTLGDAIALSRGGLAAVHDASFPTHAFMFTREQGRLFATEETPSGLVEKGLAEYCQDNNRIVSVYFWRGWQDEEKADAALRYLANVRADGARNSKYDFLGLLSFLPFIGRWFKPDPQKQICSENCASIHKTFGASWIVQTVIAPDQLEMLMRHNEECKCILNYYL